MAIGRVRLLPGALVSTPVFAISLLWATLVQLGESAAAGQDAGILVARMVSMCIVQVLMFSVPWVTWKVICPHLPPTIWTWLLLVAVLVGAVIRGVALGILLMTFGVADSPEWFFRIMASLTHMAVVTVLLWFLVSEVRELHDRRRQLTAERDQLLSLEQTARSDLNLLSTRATEEIRRSILDSLGGLTATTSAELQERLRITIDDVVRPLSHHLAAQPTAWVPPPTNREVTRADWHLAAREGLDPARIHPVIVPIVLIWLGLPIHLFRFGPLLTAGLVATLIIAIPAFWFFRNIAVHLTADHGSGIKAAGFVSAVALGGMALGLATVPYMLGQPQPLLFILAGPVLALLVSAPLAIAETARDQDLELESDLIATAANLRWALVRARESYRQQESALAHALHGRLQASLAAAYLRLDRAVNQGTDDDAFLAAIQAEVMRAVHTLDVVYSEPEPVEKIISLTQGNWAGAAQVNFIIDSSARLALAGDSLCGRSVNDLIPELVFNSIRHGGATVVDVKIDIADDITLTLSVIDNGSGDFTSTHYGLGSTLLDETSVSWERTRQGDHTMTLCRLPYLSTQSTVAAE